MIAALSSQLITRAPQLARVLALVVSLGACPQRAHAFGSSAPHPDSTSVPRVEASPLGPGMVTLSSALREHLNGQSFDDPAKRQELAHFADEFVEFGKLRERSPRRREIVEKCVAAPSANPFCGLILDPNSYAHEKPVPRHRRERVASSVMTRIRRALTKPDIEELNHYPEPAILGALKKLPKHQSVQPAMEKAIAEPTCPSTAVLTALGLRAERDFPDPTQIELAVKLYSRSMACGDDLSSVRAEYRLGLIQAWQGHWSEVERVFKPVSESALATDFKQRAIYWRYYAAKKLGDLAQASEMQHRLLREYPLSLHALLVGDGTAQLENHILNPADPVVEFRSATAISANTALTMAELLQERGDEQGATRVLDHFSEELKLAEAPVQLYATVLLMRSNEVLRKFKWMAALFHDNPNLISPPTLEMLYPLKRFELMRVYESKVDPYLLISLIRQESAFNEHARSGVGALGLMQLMPATARHMDRTVSRQGLFDPAVNIRLGVRVFKSLLNLYNGDVELALAAYNAGKDRVDEWKARYPTENRLLFIDLMPFQETREYVASIARNYYWYLRLYDDAAFKSRMLSPVVAASHALSATAPVAGPVALPIPSFYVFGK